MENRIAQLTDKIAKLEKELLEELDAQQEKFQYKLEGTRIRFEEAVLDAHHKLRISIHSFLWHAPWRHIASAPFIYGMIIPLSFLDLTVTIYQHICFRLYQIPRVRRSRYVVIDRHQLAYLNGIQKFNCVYCGYGNGVIAYTREIIARTEQYWCPIKHARRVAGTHRRYSQFADFGDAEQFQARLAEFRNELRDEE